MSKPTRDPDPAELIETLRHAAFLARKEGRHDLANLACLAAMVIEDQSRRLDDVPKILLDRDRMIAALLNVAGGEVFIHDGDRLQDRYVIEAEYDNARMGTVVRLVAAAAGINAKGAARAEAQARP